MPRLGSRKSRKGCTQCKARRVKCDENRPCAACIRYGVECSLLINAAPSSVSTSSPRAQRTPESVSESINPDDAGPSSLPSINTGEPPDPPFWRLPVPQNNRQHQETWMLDLELMHHYTAHAYLTMPGVTTTKQIWGYAVPQEAFKFPFLMHSLLAFSAHHLAYLNPSQAAHFRLLSGTHQTEALTSLNSALADIQTSNCHAVFVTASLTVMNAFADARSFSLDELIEIFQLIRGMDYVLNKTTPIIEKGPFAAILRPSPGPHTHAPFISSFLIDLQSASCSAGAGDVTPIDTARMGAAEHLRASLQYAIESSPHPAMRAAMIWPIKLEAEFLDMLKERSDPGVKDLFQRYCRLLEFSAGDFWFLVGWKGISGRI